MHTYLQPKIGRLDMRDLRSKDVTEPLRQIAASAPSLAKKAVQSLNGVVDHCILEGIRDDDRVLRLRGVLPSHRGAHVPAVTREQGISPMIRAIRAHIGKNGSPYVTAKVRTAGGDGEVLFVNVITFSESAGQAPMALGDGESVSLSRTLVVKVWTDPDGVARPGLDMQAHAVLTAYHVRKRRQAVGQEPLPDDTH